MPSARRAKVAGSGTAVMVTNEPETYSPVTF